MSMSVSVSECVEGGWWQKCPMTDFIGAGGGGMSPNVSCLGRRRRKLTSSSPSCLFLPPFL